MPRRPRRLATALTTGALTTSAVVAALGGPLAGAAHADQPWPVLPAAQAAALEAPAAYVPADSCDPVAKPGVSRFAALFLATYPGTGSSGIGNTCAAEGTVSEHTEGRAWDWRVSVSDPAQADQAGAALAWLLGPDAAGTPAGNARRLGLMYVIWDKQIFGLYNVAAGWRPYSCSGVTGCHQDHVHFSFTWAGAMGRTSGWTGQVAGEDYGPCRGAGQMFAMPYSGANPVPCPAPGLLPPGSPVAAALVAARGTVLTTGSTGAAVAAVQRALGGTVADGVFGGGTRDLVTTFQRRRNLPATGTVDAATLDSLIAYTTGAVAPVTTVQSAISAKYQALGGAAGFLGAARNAEHGVAGGVAQDFAGGAVYWSAGTGAHVVYGGILAAYLAAGGSGGVAGLPTSDESDATGGRYNTFTGATVGWTPAGGAHVVYGGINARYLKAGGPTGPAGLPLTDESDAPGGRFTSFAAATVGWTPTSGARLVWGDMDREYKALGGPRGFVGLPTSDEVGATGGARTNAFAGPARIFWTPAHGAHVVYGAIERAWMNPLTSGLGYPVVDEYDVPGGRASDFEQGRLVWDRASGLVSRG